MTIGIKFNKLNPKEYLHYIDNHKKYIDFNTLGLYRSLIENDKLSLEDKIAIREHAHTFFKKSFDFLQLKDPQIFIEVSTFGMDLTKADQQKIWDGVIKNQQIILKDKRIRHRNFGTYSKHHCPYPDCPYPGLMVRPNSRLAATNMHFAGDNHKYGQKQKSEKRKLERKKERSIVDQQLADR